MIGLAARLAAASGREAFTRLAMIVVAVAVGATLLLATVAATNAARTQNDRYAWLLASEQSFAPAASGVDPMWALLSKDLYRDREIIVVDLAPTGPHPPLPPGLTRVPGPGEYALSPDLERLVRSVPAAELGDRYPGRQVATIGDAGLPGPDALIAVVGRSVDQVRDRPNAAAITSINAVSPEDCGTCVVQVGVNANGMALLLGVVALAMLFPIVVFLVAATRLSAARREQRLAALRLVGATHRQVARLSVAESVGATAVGVAVGFGLYAALRPVEARIPFTGEPFFTGDLALHAWQVLGVVLGVPLVAAVAARFAVRRLRVSPLGVARHTTPRSPRPWGFVVLGAGIVELAFFLIGPKPDTGVGQTAVYVPGFFLVMVGLIGVGPWLTMVGARALVTRARRPETLMAGRRLADNPGTGFRAVSGVVLALFVATVAVGAMATFAAHRGHSSLGQAHAGLVFQTKDFTNSLALAHPDGLDDRLRAAGATGVAALHDDAPKPVSGPYRPRNGYVLCADLAGLSGIGRCEPGATVAHVDVFVQSNTESPTTVWPTASLPVATVESLPIHTYVVATDGSAAAVERVRTVLEAANPALVPPDTADEFDRISVKNLEQYQQLATVVVVTSLPIAGCSLAVGVVAGLADRRRPFSLLRLAGTPTRVLRRVIAWESVTPLLVGAAVAVAAGLGAAAVFTQAQLGYALTLPGVSFWLLVGAGLVVALLVVGSTFPLVERTTGAEVARND